MRGHLADLLLRGRSGTVVLAVSVTADDRRYPTVQRFASGLGPGEPPNRPSCRAATGDPAVIVRQDLAELARHRPGRPVVLAPSGDLDLLPFLADLWHAPIGVTPLARQYDLAPVAVGIDPAQLLRDLRCIHDSAAIRVGDAGRATTAEAAARLAEAADVLLVPDEPDEPDDEGGLARAGRAVLAHLNPSAALTPMPVGLDSAAARAARSALLAPLHHVVVASRLAGAFEPVGLLPRQVPVLDDVASVRWQARRPFHPQRLARALPTVMRSVARSRGHLWLASRPGSVVSWRSAGRHLELREEDRWLEEDTADAWHAASPERRTLAAWHWDPYFGERRSELVFVGAGLDRDRLCATLDAALLDDGELAAGPDGWRHLTDPLLGGPAVRGLLGP
ncbi:cobalamin biosynthesis protein CobW [Kitasatospora aureofaciens]|nr:cobalamin biosynthesis protein CobW [Kitasatospora aureofaciens]